MRLPRMSEEEIRSFIALLLSYSADDKEDKEPFMVFFTPGKDAGNALAMIYREAVKLLTVYSNDPKILHKAKAELLLRFLSGGDISDMLKNNSAILNMLNERIGYCR